MNIIKTTRIGLATIMLCAVCAEPYNGPDPITPSGIYKSLEVVAEVSATESPIKIADHYEILLFGNTTSCNLSESGSPCITVSGTITQPDSFGNFDFEEGEFQLKSTTTNCELWGQFHGKGTMSGNQIMIKSEVEVTCGTGAFKAKGGDLTMTISGLLPEEDSESTSYQLSLDGLLEI